MGQGGGKVNGAGRKQGRLVYYAFKHVNIYNMHSEMMIGSRAVQMQNDLPSNFP